MAKVLIIEDDQDTIDLYSETLQKEGFEILTAQDGKEGIVQAVQKKPDIILLDIRIPEIDGILVLQHLKKLPETQNIPVVFLTLLPEELHSSEDIEHAVAYIHKPEIGPQDLIDQVKKILAQYQSNGNST